MLNSFSIIKLSGNTPAPTGGGEFHGQFSQAIGGQKIGLTAPWNFILKELIAQSVAITQ